MGSALLSGWLDRGIKSSDITVIEPFKKTASKITKNFNVTVVSNPSHIPENKNARVIVFAIKPQSMDESIVEYANFVDKKTVFLSIAAGKTTDYFQSNLSIRAAIVRAMPNTPAAVGRGITVTFANANTTNAQIKKCNELLKAVGTVVQIENEELMDAITALSGSGPAYVFALTECMANAGVRAGLPIELANRLARETVAGAGELLYRTSESACELRKNVTSPGGTTAAALEILLAKGNLKELMVRAISSATKRSQELAK